MTCTGLVQSEMQMADLNGLVSHSMTHRYDSLYLDYSDFSFTKWNAGEPSYDYHGNPEDCLAIYSNGYWNDDSCDIDRYDSFQKYDS